MICNGQKEMRTIAERKRILSLCSRCFIIIIFLVGCTFNPKPVTSTEQPGLRKKRLKTENYKTDDKFWNMAYKEIPTVSFEDVTGGEYIGTYVCLDSVGISAEEENYSVDGWKEVNVELAIPREDGSFYSYRNKIVKSKNSTFEYGIDVLQDIEVGDAIKLCLYLNANDVGKAYVVGAKKIGEDDDFDLEKYREDAAIQIKNEEEEKQRIAEKKANKEAQSQVEKPVREYDALQKMFLGISAETKETDIEKLIKECGLYYSREVYNGDPKKISYAIAFSEGSARHKRADPGDQLCIAFSESDGTILYAEYNREGSSRTALFYNYGTYWDFRESAPGKYSGYYYYRPGDLTKTGIKIEYSNGYVKETSYYRVSNAESAL